MSSVDDYISKIIEDIFGLKTKLERIDLGKLPTEKLASIAGKMAISDLATELQNISKIYDVLNIEDQKQLIRLLLLWIIASFSYKDKIKKLDPTNEQAEEIIESVLQLIYKKLDDIRKERLK